VRQVRGKKQKKHLEMKGFFDGNANYVEPTGKCDTSKCWTNWKQASE
jgi:hypothetical protein